MSFRPSSLLPALSALALTCLITGCGVSPTMNVTSSPTAAALSGKVMGGQQPVAYAELSLYAAGSGGTGLGAQQLLTPGITTNQYGFFTITGDYKCPSDASQVYLVARKGNPGLSDANASNPALELMAALGDCGNLSDSTNINVNEVTTVAGVWALEQFMGPDAAVGASSTNATGLRNAFLVANNLVDTSKGIVGGPTLPAGATIEAAKINTLADALATCVNSDGTTMCAPLFAAATVGGVAPTNTVDAALNIVTHPGSHVSDVFDAVMGDVPFMPTLAKVPNDWTLSVTYVGGGLSHPTALAIDSTGSVWAANYGDVNDTSVATKMSVTGVPATATGYAAGSLYESYGITVDGNDNVWVTSQQTRPVNAGAGAITKLSSTGMLDSGSGFKAGGVYFPVAVAANQAGDIWVANYGDSTASLLSANGASLAGNSGFTPDDLPLPFAVAVDANGDAWFAVEAGVTKVTADGNSSEYSCCSEPSGLAVDQQGNVWVADYLGQSLIEVSSSGATEQTLTKVGGIKYPQSVAIDGVGNVWMTNYHGASLSAFTGAASGVTSTALSPGTGFGVDAGLIEPFGEAIDASGNLWVANAANTKTTPYTLTQFVGLASPIKTPLLGPPSQP